MNRARWFEVATAGFTAGCVALGAQAFLDGSRGAAALFGLMAAAGASVLLVTHS